MCEHCLRVPHGVLWRAKAVLQFVAQVILLHSTSQVRGADSVSGHRGTFQSGVIVLGTVMEEGVYASWMA